MHGFKTWAEAKKIVQPAARPDTVRAADFKAWKNEIFELAPLSIPPCDLVHFYPLFRAGYEAKDLAEHFRARQELFDSEDFAEVLDRLSEDEGPI